jgi:hypothetical protein
MNNFMQKLSSEWAVRLGLGLMYLYSGYDLFMNPKGWYWAVRPVPQAIQDILVNPIGIDNFLKIQGLGEIALAVAMLAWFFPRWVLKIAAVLSVIEMAAILLMTGIDAVTFRDIGLLGASNALLIMAYQKNEQRII